MSALHEADTPFRLGLMSMYAYLGKLALAQAALATKNCWRNSRQL
jgi:hypothetical protein